MTAALTPISMQLAARDPEAFATALGESYARYGFAVVSDHGLPQDVIARALAATRDFFALPEPVKRRYRVPNGAGQRGYTPFGVEAAKDAPRADLKEFWHIGRTLPVGHAFASEMPENVWPAELAAFEADTRALYDALDAMGGVLLSAIARFLSLPPTFFEAPVRDGNSVLRLLHYPPLRPGAEGERAGAHEDINVITLLLGAEEAGLQLRDRDGAWIDVNPPPGALVVNIGDMLQRLTNNRLPSTTHRVVNPSRERAHLPRYSIPFFLHFAPDYMIRTLPSCVDAAHPDSYPTPITAQAYLEERLAEIKLA